ncbi:TAXI family TRAP transporter solute-binding subunit [Enterovirga aerilata]|uniref:TAXI family TRAP transporter solute-binding subunit n=1 Tax=Enterovirga aerilata TaxID=2730920 RepID=A0A849I1K5_9HYPH|nr:TAXI family TRAP transporter solute-binding subunit [Enterovirga sp. DB1703]NNM73666.1 TAXI family TRAP transporter solute-binding subunit [Enterovirga sp. DB1703]
MRRTTLLSLAALLLMLGASLVAWRLISAPTVLRVAVGPLASEDARLVAAAGQYLAREHEALRLKIVATEGEAESARALDEGRADLAVVRTDVAMPEKAQAVAILHRDAVVIVAPPTRGIATISDLRDRTVGIVRRMPANLRLLELLLAHYELPKESVRTMMLDGPEQVEAALRSGQIDAALAVGTVTGRTVIATVTAVTAAGDGAGPVFLAVGEAEAIAQPSPHHDTFDIVRGAFGGTPPRPTDTVKTLGVNHVLVAATSLPDADVSELTRLLFTLRPVIARDIPLANRIEAPELENGPSTLTVHPGAVAYYEDEVLSFFDRYSDWFYLGLFAVSILGSGLAWIASQAFTHQRASTLSLLDRVLEIVRQARTADRLSELDELERETDDILGVALTHAGTGRLDQHGVSAFTLGLDQARHAIAERRRALGRSRQRLGRAAE